MKVISSFLFFVSLSLNALVSEPVSTGEIHLNVEGIKKLEGNIGVLVFNKEQGFPLEPEYAILDLEVKVTSNVMKINLGKLPYGNYAIALIQDINSNKMFDKNIIGIPKEPFGFSNNKSILFGLPNFNEATVSLSREREETTIRLIDLSTF
jgi:uncharacterized protein (DUF2141 family)